jgi:deazaflavin-dependent oxidoreductase (nitroreductase family)
VTKINSSEKPKREVRPDLWERVSEHIALYLSDPEAAHIWDSTVIGIPGPIKTLLLTTTGRKSGEARHVALQYFKPEGDFAVIASKAGAHRHPAWYLNLVVNPRCKLQVGADSFDALARTAQGEERERLWDAICAEQPEYPKYQSWTDREIPVVVFELVDEG